MKQVGVLPHLGKDEVKPVAEQLIKWLERRGLAVSIPDEDAAALDLARLGVDEDVLANVEMLVVLGGDGTILRAAQLLQGREVPLLGVNLGKIGFLTEVEVAGLYEVLEEVLRGQFELEKRLLLSVVMVYRDGRREERVALNEVVVERGAYERVMDLDVFIDDTFFTRHVADGVILATPTGSTAYSFSAGGPITSPAARVFLLTPICPHSLFGRTLVLSEKERVKIAYDPVYKGGGLVSVDGFKISDISEIDNLQVSVADGMVCLVRRKKRSFYALLREKLRAWDVPLGPPRFD